MVFADHAVRQTHCSVCGSPQHNSLPKALDTQAYSISLMMHLMQDGEKAGVKDPKAKAKVKV